MIKSNLIWSGVVICNPDLIKLKKIVNAFEDQVNTANLPSNGSCLESGIAERFQDKNFEIIGFVGIAKKFNEICRLAAQNSADDVVTFDQDSLPNDGFVSGSSKEVLQVFQTGCWWVKKIHLINREHSVTSARMLLSSGILLKIAAWDE